MRLAVTLLLPAVRLPLCSSSLAAAETPAPPRQEIWYHTGYPGGVGGQSGGMSALMGPTKMPAIFEAIWKRRLIEPTHLHTDSPLVIGRSPAAPPIDLESLRAVHTDHYIKAILTGEPRSLATSQGLPAWTADLARGWLLNVGGLYAASAAALRHKTITASLDTLVRLRTGTVKAANQVLALMRPGDRIEHRGPQPYAWSSATGLIRFPDWVGRVGGMSRANAPQALSDADVQDFAAARERRMREEGLAEALLREAYQFLFSP